MVIAIYLVILVGAFYFLIVRPQRRQQMIRRQLIATVGVGDEIVTSGGLFGTVAAIDGDTLQVEIAPGVVVKLARGAVAQKVSGMSDDEGIYRIGDAPVNDEIPPVDGGDDDRDDDTRS